MKIVVVGAGWTGLVAGYRLLQRGHEVVIVEQSAEPGGLATSFRPNGWRWTLEKFYHHWFTNDAAALGLARELAHPVLTLSPKTAVWYRGVSYPFDSARSVLAAPFLSLSARVRLGSVVAWLKLHPHIEQLAAHRAMTWLKRYMGTEAVKAIWEPLLLGKFGKYAATISLTWFAARIKKRTARLAYPVGGFAAFQATLLGQIEKLGGTLSLAFPVAQITTLRGKRWRVVGKDGTTLTADAVLLTTPSAVTARLVPTLPVATRRKLNRIRHLSAQVLVLESKRPLLSGTYWLNIAEIESPFLAIVAHTNMLPKRHYGGSHITYIGNYLPPDHPYLSLSAAKLLRVFAPKLDSVSPGWRAAVTRTHLWQLPHAQPVVDTAYAHHLPPSRLAPSLYLANMDMVYPWDRGTNYAMSEGEHIAHLIDEDLAKRM